ncbi:hypothetical protein M436DRAFT_61101 [Aureobasidium namibiae CBS 147.97]|uniref:Uncharacterized protein n=1 Tax=Aureobasidium namibiae CBS 147.97 TaxID=1043004 RepID=A0A074WW80_9PEZI|nr:uncharacterized protein M436DRAFT_61101 [Aureobasidium namibiae CBS 147.97]KEQ75784.1 hypothetical protein M436DRAFT_61101 [Aureobasidium namibiae CBS 147.97]
MYGHAILRRNSNGVPLECVIPKPGYEGPRGGTPHLAQIKESGRTFVPTFTRVRRGSKSYVEPRVDYCSTASQFKAVRDGLVKHPTWERLDLQALLKIQYAQHPKIRHLYAGYAFQRNGTPKSEYAEPLAIYARLHPELVAEHKAKRLREEKRRKDLRLDSSARTNARTNKNVLPPSSLHPRAVGSRAVVAVQRQNIVSAETDDEDISDTEDEKPARGRDREDREPSENRGELSWMAKLDEGREFRESLKERRQMAQDSLCRRGPSPDSQRTRLRC